MLLSEYVALQKRGFLSQIQRDTGLAWSTIFLAARHCKPISRDATAKKICDYTDGAVSVEELKDPASFGGKRWRKPTAKHGHKRGRPRKVAKRRAS